MLANLLPGFREVRAPLAAGYVLLLTAWLAFEPLVPGPRDAEGLLAAGYRAAGLFTAVGWAAALSFVAYLLGSLSTLLVLSPYRLFLTPSLRQRRHLDPLTHRTRRALQDVAEARLRRLDGQLVFTTSQVDDVLAAIGDTDQGTDGWRKFTVGRAFPKRPRPHGGPGHALPDPDPAAGHTTSIQARILGDLELVATTRLLGTEPDLYQAVDRDRAEVDFRVALLGPVLLLSVAIAFRSGFPAGLWWLLGGVVLTVGLAVDAVQQQRVGLGRLVDLLATDRVQVPVLERLDEEARKAAQAELDAARLAAVKVDRALRTGFGALRRLGTSEPALAMHARREAEEAYAAMLEFQNVFPDPRPFGALASAVFGLRDAAQVWVEINEGHPPQEGMPTPQEMAASARGAWLTFVRDVRMALADLEQVQAPTADAPGK